ncbi:MAG: TerB family tellurite resistance protein [Steroidobacteraceae bacterium]
MLRILTDLFESLGHSQEPARDADLQHTLQLATAVLLIEVVRADGKIDAVERQAVLDALRTRFALSEAELTELFALAQQRSEDSHDLYSFTARLNQTLDEPQRVRVFEMLWSVAYADGQADAHETHLLRRVADLLHLRHGDAIGAKLRAERLQRQ